jgi:hypothetical protein
MYTGFWWGWGDPGVDERILLKWIFKTWDGEANSGLIWLRIGKVGEVL